MSSNCNDKNKLTCWICSKAVIGMENQCKGLAQALDLQPIIKKIDLCSPWRELSPFLRCGLKWAFSKECDSLLPPWPDLIICSGRAGGMAAIYAQNEARKEGKKIYTVYIQNPVINPSVFDVVATPIHDNLKGDNVISTRGSLHRITKDLLKKEAEKFKEYYSDLPENKIAVVIGGSNSVYKLTPKEMKPLAQKLAKLSKEKNIGLMVTASRRTGEENIEILKNELKETKHNIWDGKGDNPYYGMLGLAKTILVTEDSVNMTSEACSTGKPVYILPLKGGANKFKQFHKRLKEDGMTRIFNGNIEDWNYKPLDDVTLVADKVRKLFC